MANTLAAHAVPPAAADGRLKSSGSCGPAASVLLGGIVVALRALAVWPQATRVAQADAALEGAVALAAFGAVRLGFGLALAVALEGHGDGEGVLEADGLDDEGFLLLFGATASASLHAERDLEEKQALVHTCVWLKHTQSPFFLLFIYLFKLILHPY